MPLGRGDVKADLSQARIAGVMICCNQSMAVPYPRLQSIFVSRLVIRDLNLLSLDRIAMGLSGLCFMHCVASVVAVTILASAGGLLLHPAIHEVGLALATALAVVGFGHGMRVHRRKGPALVGLFGICGMAAALLAPHGLPEMMLTLAGVSLVALGHGLNRRAFV